MPPKKPRKKYEYRTYPITDPQTQKTEELTILQACQRYEKTYSTVNTRIYRNGGDLQKAIFEPVNKHTGADPTKEWQKMTRRAVPDKEIDEHWERFCADKNIKSSC